MRIAVIPPYNEGEGRPVENFFRFRALEECLVGSEIVRFALDSAKPEALVAEWNRCDAVIFLGNGWLTSRENGKLRLTPDHLRSVKVPMLALSLGIRGEGEADFGRDASELLKVMKKQGKISAADRATQTFVADIVGKDAVRLVGCPSSWLKTRPLQNREGRRVLLPTLHDPAFPGRAESHLHRLIRRYHSRALHQGRVLFLCADEHELELGARPGPATLYQPRYPELHLKALASATAVIGFRIEPLLAAVAQRVPALLLGNHVWSKQMAETAGIPFLELNTNTSALELEHRGEEMLRRDPWEVIEEKTAFLRGAFVDFLKDVGAKPQARRTAKNEKEKAAASTTDSASPVSFATITDIHYLPFALGLVENVSAIHDGPVTAHVLALDERARTALKQWSGAARVVVHTMADLWNADELPIVASRAVGLRAFSSKARLLSRALEATNGPVLYCDSDVFFFASPEGILNRFDEAEALLFPHWNDNANAARTDGLYNAGMVAVRPGAERFLEWWGKLCLDRCELRHTEGMVADQGYLDFAPLLFPEVRPYRGRDENVARWNLRSLGVRRGPSEGGAPRLQDGTPVRSFHTAFSDGEGFFEAKYGWDQISAFFSPIKGVDREAPLVDNVLHQQSHHWLDLGRFLNAQRLAGEWVLPLSHRPLTGELAFFVTGLGRFFVRWIARTRRPGVDPIALPMRAPSDAMRADSLWVRLQRTLLFDATFWRHSARKRGTEAPLSDDSPSAIDRASRSAPDAARSANP